MLELSETELPLLSLPSVGTPSANDMTKAWERQMSSGHQDSIRCRHVKRYLSGRAAGVAVDVKDQPRVGTLELDSGNTASVTAKAGVALLQSSPDIRYGPVYAPGAKPP